MTAQLDAQSAEMLQNAVYVWFTTVREDGMPQPTPVWFIQDGDSYLIYSMPSAQKVKNIRASSKVALSFAPNADAERYLVIMGHATVDPGAPKALDHAGYRAKYAPLIPGIGMTEEQFSSQFTTPIRVLPTRVRSE
ncbi:MAG: pyridoxamine 5'-phosphate oxidase family protein [Anaerolineae bacterium]